MKPGGRGETYAGSLQWLEDAGIICRCYNTDITGLPMEGNAKDNVFKVYMSDIGLLVEMLGGEHAQTFFKAILAVSKVLYTRI